MRLGSHPVHVLLVHFPVALWPAHEGLHLFAARLPAGTSVVGFWLLLAGTALGWLAAFFGALDLMELWERQDRTRVASGFVHAIVNGSVLLGFTALLALEYRDFPTIVHGRIFLGGETLLLIALGVGNYFGGKLVWGSPDPTVGNSGNISPLK